MFGIAMVIVFQNIFRLEMYQNNFIFLIIGENIF